MADTDTNDILTLTTEIVASFVGSSSHMKAEEIPALIRSVRQALSEDATPAAPAEPETQKATKAQVSKSITPDALISFLDGKPYKTLKRHISTNGFAPDSYRERFGLPRDYPMVSASYSRQRSQLARDLGLGQGGRAAAKAATPSETVTDAPKASKPSRKTGGGPAKGKGTAKGRGAKAA